jgi:hypothetical protein
MDGQPVTPKPPSEEQLLWVQQVREGQIPVTNTLQPAYIEWLKTETEGTNIIVEDIIMGE